MDAIRKKALTETDIRTKFIIPAVVGESGAGWDVMTQVREEVLFTKACECRATHLDRSADGV